MNIIQASQTNNAVRRKGNSFHSGSNGTGYVDIKFLLSNGISLEDLHANDWEAKRIPREWEVYITSGGKAVYSDCSVMPNSHEKILVREVIDNE